MNICVVIPAFNEAETIGPLIKEIKSQCLEVLVIDDGSKDNTADASQKAGARVLINKKNCGKGVSLIKGFKYAVENNFDCVIAMDGDGQHLATDIPAFIQEAKNHEISVLVGNRMPNAKNMPILRFFTNQFMSWLISLLCKQQIPDSQCGFRLVKRAVLEKVKLNTANFEIESELLIKASRQGFKIAAVPITTVYRNEKSKINPFIDTFRFIKFIFKTWISRN